MSVEQRKAVYLVQGQKIIYSKKDSYSGSLLTNTLGVYEFEFRTDSEWTEFDKVALYLQATGVQPIYIELTDTNIATCTTGQDGNKIYKVPVPEQMLTKAGQLTVGLIGYYSNQDDFRFPTNTDSSYRIAASVQPLDGKQYPQYISIMEQILLRLYKGQGGSTEDLTELRRQIAQLNQLLKQDGDGTQFLSNDGTYKTLSQYDDTEIKGLIANKVDIRNMYKSIKDQLKMKLNWTNGPKDCTFETIDAEHLKVTYPAQTASYYCYNQLLGTVADLKNAHVRVTVKNLNDTAMPVLNKLLLSYRQDWSKQIKHANTLDNKDIPAGATKVYDFNLSQLIAADVADTESIYLVVGADHFSYNYLFIVSCEIEYLNNTEYYTPYAGTADNAVESQHATLSDNSCDTKHATLGAKVFTEWDNGFVAVKENYTLKDGQYRFKFRKGVDAEPSNWWGTILSCNLGTVSELAGKKLIACFAQCIDTGYLKFKKICISSKSGNWSTSYDIVTDFSNDRLYAVVDLDDVIASGKVETAEGKNLYLLAGAVEGTDVNPQMNHYDIDWTASAAIINKDALNGIGVAQFLGRYTPNDIQKLNSTVAALAQQVDATEKYITCWGDSLTAMGGWTTKLQELSGLTVYNGGVGGENTKTIVARQGGDAIVLNNITIPGDGTAVEIAKYTDGGIDTVLGNKVTPALQGNGNLNPVDVDGVECSIKWTGSSYSDTAGTWTIKRTTTGEDIVINRPTVVRTAFDRLYNDPYLMIIFIGQNKGYNDDYEILIEQHKRIIEHANAKHVIVLGLSSGDTASRTDYEARMKKEFGRYFISLREYLAHPIYGSDGSTIVSCYGIDDQGLTADTAYSYGGNTYNSLEEIARGKVPHQILMDGLHFSSGTRTVIGNLIYKRCKELNIF